MSDTADPQKDAARKRKPADQRAVREQWGKQRGQEQQPSGQQPSGQQPERLHADHDPHLEDEEKLLAGRHDVNYPALLTKDVPGG